MRPSWSDSTGASSSCDDWSASSSRAVLEPACCTACTVACFASCVYMPICQSRRSRVRLLQMPFSTHEWMARSRWRAPISRLRRAHAAQSIRCTWRKRSAAGSAIPRYPVRYHWRSRSPHAWMLPRSDKRVRAIARGRRGIHVRSLAVSHSLRVERFSLFRFQIESSTTRDLTSNANRITSQSTANVQSQGEGNSQNSHSGMYKNTNCE